MSTTTTREHVTFTVPDAINGIPADTYDGYIDTMHIPMRGQTVDQIGRAMLHITREDHPECFSDKNSFTAVDIDVTSEFLNGTITRQ